ncbi:MAG: phosphoenolpyruvate carboxykinase (ATP) [Pseudomonadales bacterium]|nr:phosphoenolpyruvate carboxykinase (ATP) [Pseudomonadales bacterium]
MSLSSDTTAARDIIDPEPACLIEMAVAAGEGALAACGALCVATGERTSRSPQDSFIVSEPSTADVIDWGPDCQPFESQRFDELWARVSAWLAEQDTFTSHVHAGTDAEQYLPIEIRTETAWHNLYAQLIFARPSVFNPKAKEIWKILHAPGFVCEPGRDGSHSEGIVVINFAKRRILVAGIAYAGDLRTAVFVAQNFLLPEKDILPMHCAAVSNDAGEVSMFFGHPETGKTALSADPAFDLIGDDAHGWSKDAVFNLEGGSDARCLNLDAEDQPLIFQAVRFGTILENVALDPDSRQVDFSDTSLTDNGRACYPLTHISRFRQTDTFYPRYVFFLVCDRIGVMPLVSVLSPAAAAYHFVSGYDGGKTAGTISFSPCFGEEFFPRRVEDYADLLMKRFRESATKVFLINTGWCGASSDENRQRYPLSVTRQVISAIHTGALDNAELTTLLPLNLTIPKAVPGLDPDILNPANSWRSREAYEQAAEQLAAEFTLNFARFEIDEDIRLAGPVTGSQTAA